MIYSQKGFCFKPDGNYPWMHYYAGPLTPVLFDNFIRVYFTTRSEMDSQGMQNSYISFVDCDINDPTKVLYVHDKPILEFGPAGTFDEDGTTVCEVLKVNGKIHLYYLGWQRTHHAPYIIRMGLAISDDGAVFQKISEGPVLGLHRHMPYGIGNVSIIVEAGIYHMWYTHYLPWIPTSRGYRPTYDIRYATSENGLDWQFGDRCIWAAGENEAIASPSVKKMNDVYHMWYCYRPEVDSEGRSGPYKIGHAISTDKTNWTRLDHLVNIETSETGWDSEMICYPEALITPAGNYLFYSGNNYGRDGFGFSKFEI